MQLDWISPFTSIAWLAIVGACLLGWICVRWLEGPSLVGWRWNWFVLRAVGIGILILIGLGPTLVEETRGPSKRASIAYLFDGSQSMKLGGEQSRWEESLKFKELAEKQAGLHGSGDTRAFRFGHRLEPLSGPPGITPTSNSASDRPASGQDNLTTIAPPEATDSRLADALRQLSPQLDAKQTAGVILFSDGRVRASEAVERMAAHLGKSGIPIHVVPVGEVSGTGDIAIVSLVTEPKVRKFTENQLTLFVRSFGMSGKRTMVRLLGSARLNSAEPAVLAEIPITLTGGAQSVTLPYRIDDRPEELRVLVEPIPGELTERNNRIATQVEIDRTKVRILLIEGDRSAALALANSGSRSDDLLSPFRTDTVNTLNIVDALQADEDIECNASIDQGNGQLIRLRGSSTGASGFPKTRAELFAFDGVIFSNFSPELLSDNDRALLAAWIEGRGGSLIVTGNQIPNDVNGANKGVMQSLWPVESVSLGNEAVSTGGAITKQRIVPMQELHPIWRLRLDDERNRELLKEMPAVPITMTGLKPKPGAEVLATTEGTQEAAIVTHRVGRGRVLISAADLSGTALSELGVSWGSQPERIGAKLWRNLVYWITEGSSGGRRRLIAEPDKRFYRPGEKISIKAIAYDETARRSNHYRLWAMVEPAALDDPSNHAPILWPEGVVRVSGEVGPRVAWGEELPLPFSETNNSYEMQWQLSETSASGDTAMRIELTAYEGQEGQAGNHGTQVDSTSLSIQVLSDPYEQQNPLPNRQLMTRIAELSGGKVLHSPSELSQLLSDRQEEFGPPIRDVFPAWNRWWLWLGIVTLLSVEWTWRRLNGFA